MYFNLMIGLFTWLRIFLVRIFYEKKFVICDKFAVFDHNPIALGYYKMAYIRLNIIKHYVYEAVFPNFLLSRKRKHWIILCVHFEKVIGIHYLHVRTKFIIETFEQKILRQLIWILWQVRKQIGAIEFYFKYLYSNIDFKTERFEPCLFATSLIFITIFGSI